MLGIFPRKNNAIFPEISGKIPPEISGLTILPTTTTSFQVNKIIDIVFWNDLFKLVQHLSAHIKPISGCLPRRETSFNRRLS